MSDHQQGATWWRASDGRWYPPEEHPRFAELCDEVASAYPVETAWQPDITTGEASPPVGSPLAVGGVPPRDPVGGSDLPPERRGSYWFSPPAAIAIVGWLASLVFGLLTPGRLGSFLFIGFSGLWTARAVVRVRDGYGAAVMTVVAVFLALVALVACGASYFSGLNDPRLLAASPTLPDDMVPDAGDRIAWYQLERGWCFDLDGTTRAGELTFVRIRSCEEAHRAQALVARRDEAVLTQVLRAAADAGAGGAGASTSEPPPTATAPRAADPLFARMSQWCEELAASVLVQGAPQSLTVEPLYSATVATSPHPVVVCAVVAADGGVLTRDFTR